MLSFPSDRSSKGSFMSSFDTPINPLIHVAYTDAVFKHLMFCDDMRNDFLEAV
jgi:hypothetical protein